MANISQSREGSQILTMSRHVLLYMMPEASSAIGLNHGRKKLRNTPRKYHGSVGRKTALSSLSTSRTDQHASSMPKSWPTGFTISMSAAFGSYW